ncbi:MULTISPECIES: helix-turn-helix domain-containing protein [Burkholderia]|uniref:helix-turn-helix domain-containing protein n=1 Tax=Burkholderia TaxID=32008 RepID=UPI00141E0134|nr:MULTISPECIES: helix-turn-helix domain-containing protein [Burkholderia]NIE87675.1 helix-turn-helix transcriptional regulator [Burkholderia sp. Tr-860]NIF66310.1 helix-turn-helix transcriptional regulator [Burkholderia sp. Cy-647]NIF74588.1 helix-turn-helix transcriptional regulator [Burkholderia sp. Ap-962]NIF93256.1 helix-turn-helix transcriptional regulator [Burkholderia sp. Cy-637]NIG00413.1 helix-turn-helix transcriptional regulator [Burkholderia sp. Ax-1720]
MNAHTSLHSPAELGRLIRERRKADGLTQETLAAAAGVGRRVVADLEDGGNVSSHVLLPILERLGIGLVPSNSPAYPAALLALCRTASTSYHGNLPPAVMERFLLTGKVSLKWATLVDYALEETPPMLFEKAIATWSKPTRARIRENLRNWAASRQLNVPEEFRLA